MLLDAPATIGRRIGAEWAESVGEREAGVASVSAPVLDARRPGASPRSACRARSSARPASPGARYGDAVVAAARRIERAAGLALTGPTPVRPASELTRVARPSRTVDEPRAAWARHLAAIDIGTNSIHLVVARFDGDGHLRGDRREKEMVRLGSERRRHEGARRPTPSTGASPRSTASARSPRSATPRSTPSPPARCARPRTPTTFIDRARDEAGVDVEVISGVEEARLIHLGVLQAVPVFDKRLLLVDIGGGSTEVLVGERGETLAVPAASSSAPSA